MQYLGMVLIFILLHTCMVDLKQKRDKIGRDNSQKSRKRFIHTGMPVCMRIRRTILPTKHCIHFRTVSS